MNSSKWKRVAFLVASHIVIFLIALQNQDISVLTWISLVQLMILCYVMGKNNGKSAFLPISFIIISYIFNFSGLVLGEIIGFRSGYLYYLKFDEDIIQKTIIYYFSITGSIALGACFPTAPFRFNVGMKIYNESTIKKVSQLFLLIGVIPHIILVVMLVRARFSGGYAATYDINRQGIGFLSAFFYYGVLLLMYIEGKKKNAIILLIIVIPIELLSMLSGRRYEAISFLIAMTIIYMYKYDKLNKKTIIKGSFAAIIGIIIINAFGTMREGDFSLMFDIKRFGSSNMIYNFFTEMGNTIRTLLLTIKNVPSSIPYSNGSNYIEFIPRIIPGVNAILGGEYNFTMLLPDNENIGGSYIAELYYNFGYYGIIVAFIIGRLLMRFDRSIRLKNSYRSVIAICLLLPTIEYIRDIVYVYKYGIYFVIITFFFCLVLNCLIVKKRQVNGY